MPIQFPDFQRISFNEANPALVGVERGQALMQNFMKFPENLRAKILANQIAAVQAQYAEPMAKGNLTKLNQENEWNPKIWNSEIGLRGAQSGLAGSETRKNNYLLEHPGFMGGEETKSLEALRQMGLVDKNYQQGQQSQSNQQPVYQPSAGNGTSAPVIQIPNKQLEGNGVNTPLNSTQLAEATARATQIAKAIGDQQKSMGIPQNEISNGVGTTNGTGFNVNGLVQALIQKPMTDLQYKQTLTKVMQQNLAGKSYTSMPSVEKEYALSQARAFGYTGEQASKMFNQGYDLSSMAQSKGYDANNPASWPAAKGAPTAAIQTRIQRANSTLSALDAVEPTIAASYAKYSPRFHNISPSMIKDMISGEHPEDQADALAAYALYPEISALRINAMGGNVGEGAIQNIADASFARLNTLGISPNSHVYQLVQKRIQNLIQKMNKAENSAIYGQANRTYQDDDMKNDNNNNDMSNVADEELHRILGGK